jgi:hypothetical protein
VAAVPAKERASYVEETTANRAEVSTSGLLRDAACGAARPASVRPSLDHPAIGAEAHKAAVKVYRELLSLASFRPESLVSSLDHRQRRYLVRTLDQLSTWLDDVRRELAVHRVTLEKDGE